MKDKLVKRTKRQAITLCKRHWQRIKETKAIGDDEKDKAFNSLHTQTDPEKCCGCFACEYRDTHYYGGCGEVCILSNIWPDNCTALDDSPYMIWNNTSEWTPRVEKAVDEIISGCDEALELLNKKGKRP
jgi:hypothetical protein